MLERIMDYFWAEPERLETWGRGVISASCVWLLLGTVMTAAVFIVQTATRSTGVSLETLFPGLPAWLLPETVEGTLPALVPLVLGYRLKRLGALYKTQY